MSLVSVISEFLAVPVTVALILLCLNYAFREQFYELLDWLLIADSKSFLAAGEVISITDCFVKSLGLFFLFILITTGSVVAVSPSTSAWRFIGVSTAALFILRRWIYPFIVNSFNTKSKFDDFLFVMDLFFRTAGTYQGISIL